MQPRLKGVAGIQMLWDAYICQCGGAERPMCRKQPRRVKRRTEDVWGWKRCTQQSSFSLTALSHGHTLLSQSTHSYNSCFVSWVMFCSAVVSLWGVFLFCRFSLLCVGLCYSFYSRLEIHFGKTIQTKCFKSKIGFRRLFSLKDCKCCYSSCCRISLLQTNPVCRLPFALRNKSAGASFFLMKSRWRKARSCSRSSFWLYHVEKQPTFPPPGSAASLAWSRLRWRTGFSLTLRSCVACPASDRTLVTASFGAWSSDGVSGLQWTELYSLVSVREGLGSHAVVIL